MTSGDPILAQVFPIYFVSDTKVHKQMTADRQNNKQTDRQNSNIHDIIIITPLFLKKLTIKVFC